MRTQAASATFVPLDGVRLYVEDRGRGPAILFVHGYTTTSAFWYYQATALMDAYRCVSLDLRGHGRSSKNPGDAYTIEAFAEDLIGLMDRLDIEGAVLAGLSMGGSIVLRAALDGPARVHGLVLADTTAHGVGEAVASARVLARIKEVGVERASAEIIRASFGAGASRDLVEWAIGEVRSAPRHVAEEAIASLGAFDVEDRLGEIRCPSLVLVGEEDRITPPALAERLREGIAGARLAKIPGAGHFAMLEQPAAFTKILRDFLASLPARG